MLNLLSFLLFSQKQQVYFVGGTGIIKSCQFVSGSWCTVEMELNSKTKIGRIGSGTSVLLSEADDQGVVNQPAYQAWAV